MKIAISGTGYIVISNVILLAQYNTAVALDINSEKKFLPLQSENILDTYANVDDLVKGFDYKPSISIKEDVANFTRWYKNYHNIVKNSYASH